MFPQLWMVETLERLDGVRGSCFGTCRVSWWYGIVPDLGTDVQNEEVQHVD
jgi:hypothetical protein